MINPIGPQSVSGNDSDGLTSRDINRTAAVPAAPTASGPLQTGSTGDSVVLSSLAKDLQTVQSHLSDGEKARLQRIQEIQDRVMNGTYHVDSSALADKIANCEECKS